VLFAIYTEQAAIYKIVVLLAALSLSTIIAIEVDWIRNVALVTFTVLLMLIAAEAILPANRKEALRTEQIPRDEQLVSLGGPLGYEPLPSRELRERRFKDDQMVFDAVYTLDEHGHRVVPGAVTGLKDVVFFGDSFTFGTGVNDDQTLPYHFAQASGADCRPLNLAYQGYGPHQMLRALELGLIDPFLERPVQAMIFPTAAFHVLRVAGRSRWDLFGPRYELANGDGVVHRGPFHSRWSAELLDSVRKTSVGKAVIDLVQGSPYREENLRLYVAIIERAALLAREKYGAELVIVFWDDTPHTSAEETIANDRLIADLSGRGLQVARVSDLTPLTPEDYIPYDGHPAPSANRKLAAALAERITCSTPQAIGSTTVGQSSNAPGRTN
jgi:hypothetical protein